MNRKTRKLDQLWQVVGGGSLVAFLTVISTFLLGKARNRIDANAQATTAVKTASEIDNATATVGIDIYKLVNEAVQEATAELREENAGFREDIKALRLEVDAIRNSEREARAIFRRFYERFIFWNEKGRPDPIPAVRKEDLIKLGMDDLVPSDV